MGVVTVNDLSGANLFGSSAFRDALSLASKTAAPLYPGLAGPTVLLNLPPILNALIKLFKPLFPPVVAARIKFEQGPLSKVSTATLESSESESDLSAVLYSFPILNRTARMRLASMHGGNMNTWSRFLPLHLIACIFLTSGEGSCRALAELTRQCSAQPVSRRRCADGEVEDIAGAAIGHHERSNARWTHPSSISRWLEPVGGPPASRAGSWWSLCRPRPLSAPCPGPSWCLVHQLQGKARALGQPCAGNSRGTRIVASASSSFQHLLIS